MHRSITRYMRSSWSAFRHPTATQRVLVAVSLVVAVMTVREMVIYPAHYAVTALLSVVQVIAVLLIPVMPYPMGCIGCLAMLIAMLIPDPSGASMLLGTWECLFCIGYRSKHIANLVWPAAVIAIRLWFSLNLRLQPDAYLFLLALFLLCYAGGALLKQRQAIIRSEHDALLRKQAEQRIAFERRCTSAASLIHDSVTNDLVYTILTLDNLMSDTDNSVLRQMLGAVRDRSSQTLNQVREAIRVLDGDESAIAAEEDRNFTSTIREQAREGDRYLASLGFSGATHTDLATECTGIPVGLRRVILGVMRELYTNIAVHASQQGTYDIRMSADGSRCVIDAVNDVGAATLLPDKPTSRHGLNHHRRIIESYGGDFRTNREDGAWMLHIDVPRCLIESATPLSDL